jgi:ABC-type multidrug transport system fused ATPase/permease subunit
VYGRYYKKLAEHMQTALASANVVAEEALSSVPTVRAHAAETGLIQQYSAELLKFYHLTVKASCAYALYIGINTFLPQVCCNNIERVPPLAQAHQQQECMAGIYIRRTAIFEHTGVFSRSKTDECCFLQAVAAIVLLYGGHLVFQGKMGRDVRCCLA